MYKDDKEFWDSLTKDEKAQLMKAQEKLENLPIEIEDIDEEAFLEYYESYAFLEEDD